MSNFIEKYGDDLKGMAVLEAILQTSQLNISPRHIQAIYDSYFFGNVSIDTLYKKYQLATSLPPKELTDNIAYKLLVQLYSMPLELDVPYLFSEFANADEQEEEQIIKKYGLGQSTSFRIIKNVKVWKRLNKRFENQYNKLKGV